MDLFSGNVMVSLVKELDAGTLRQRVLANNIANVNTPYFKKSNVEFTSLLKEALAEKPVELNTTDARHLGRWPLLSEVEAQVWLDRSTTMRTDGNNVDMDEEMTNLAANNLQYQTVSSLLSDRYAGLKSVISGRG